MEEEGNENGEEEREGEEVGEERMRMNYRKTKKRNWKSNKESSFGFPRRKGTEFHLCIPSRVGDIAWYHSCGDGIIISCMLYGMHCGIIIKNF